MNIGLWRKVNLEHLNYLAYMILMKQGDDLLVSGINTIIGMELEPSQKEDALETSERE